MKSKLKLLALGTLLLVAAFVTAKTVGGFCDSKYEIFRFIESTEIDEELVPLSETPQMLSALMPTAPGIDVKKNSKAEIDYSNTKDGYIMVRYTQESQKQLRILVNGPSLETYTYRLKSNGRFEVFPLSDGNGEYRIGVYENISDSTYSTALSASIKVELEDELAPFLRPNQFVNYDENSKVVKRAAELTKNADGLLGKISAVYEYVTNNIVYDKELAASVKSGYLPDVDAVLAKGKGICFDYAAVTTAMLRSQMIPTKLVVGYTGNIYHAWINVYSEQTGWINSIIYFDGVSWRLMDPTYAASEGSDEKIAQYIGDAKNYITKYLY